MSDRESLLAELQELRLRNHTFARELKITREKDQQLMRLIDRLYDRISNVGIDFKPGREQPEFRGITFVIAAYNIPRQLHRTLTSLTPYYQGCTPAKLEIIVIDNGSSESLNRDDYSEFGRLTRIIRVDGKSSPVQGLNQGIREASFDTIAVMIDGAHVLSPGVVTNVSRIVNAFSRPVINVPQYTMGDVSQNISDHAQAYERESLDLERIGWPASGYSLFDYAIVPGENANKHYLAAIESNCLITTRQVWQDCGAYDERFDEPGAGLANIELFERLTHHIDNQYVLLEGEGSFHQNHGGTTTSLTSAQRDATVKKYYERYQEVTGKELNFTLRPAFVFGDVSAANRTIPTISQDYGRARNRILRQLADIYIARAQQQTPGPEPQLTLKPAGSTERNIRPVLKPLGLDQGKDKGLYGYRAILKRVHQALRPRRYLEIGVDDGGSMHLSQCPSVGIDPAFEVTHGLSAPVRIFKEESDTFFANEKRCQNLLLRETDLAFIDGMHLAEYVLRDFINVERYCAPGCTVVIDDVYPEQYAMAERDRTYNAWCGDVYKIVLILRQYRADLDVRVYEAFAGPYRKGVAIITGLDPGNRVLADSLVVLERAIAAGEYTLPTIEALTDAQPIHGIEEIEARLASLEQRAQVTTQ